MAMMRKVVHLNVFDFETHASAYAVNTQKNMFGYAFQNEYYVKEKKIYESPVYDNVEDQAFYWLAFQVNRDQFASMNRRIASCFQGNFEMEVEIQDNSLKLQFEQGSTLEYQGEHANKLLRKILLTQGK